jgi:hypothetical protein
MIVGGALTCEYAADEHVGREGAGGKGWVGVDLHVLNQRRGIMSTEEVSLTKNVKMPVYTRRFLPLIVSHSAEHQLLIRTATHPAPNTPDPMIGAIQWTWENDVQPNMNIPPVTKKDPIMVVGS